MSMVKQFEKTGPITGSENFVLWSLAADIRPSKKSFYVEIEYKDDKSEYSLSGASFDAKSIRHAYQIADRYLRLRKGGASSTEAWSCALGEDETLGDNGFKLANCDKWYAQSAFPSLSQKKADFFVASFMASIGKGNEYAQI